RSSSTVVAPRRRRSARPCSQCRGFLRPRMRFVACGLAPGVQRIVNRHGLFEQHDIVAYVGRQAERDSQQARRFARLTELAGVRCPDDSRNLVYYRIVKVELVEEGI